MLPDSFTISRLRRPVWRLRQPHESEQVSLTALHLSHEPTIGPGDPAAPRAINGERQRDMRGLTALWDGRLGDLACRGALEGETRDEFQAEFRMGGGRAANSASVSNQQFDAASLILWSSAVRLLCPDVGGN